METKLTCLEKLVVGNQGDSQALQLIIQDLQLAEAQIAGYVKVAKLAQARKDPGQTRYRATSTGRPVSPRNVLRHFQLTLEKLGLPKVTFHSLRHLHASYLLRQNIHPKVVQERLGHSSIALTLDVYSHIIPTLQKAAAEKINDIF